MTRPLESILAEADRLVDGDRQSDYGHPSEDHARLAGLVSALLSYKLTKPLTADDMGLVMICVKLSREAHKHKRDNLVDIAGYAKTVQMVHEANA